MSFITSPGVIVPPLTAGGVAYGTGSQAKVTSAGTVGQVLTSAGAGVPTFSTVAANVSSFSAGSTGLTPATATTGAVALAGTLAVGSGGTGLGTLTANNVILGNGASNPTFVAPSTSGNLLTSNGTTWTSATPAVSASGLTLITTLTASTSASLTFTNTSITSTYDNYLFVFTGLTSTDNNVFLILQTSTNNGSTFATTATDYQWAWLGARALNSTPGFTSNSTTADSIRMGNQTALGSAGAPLSNLNGQIYMIMPLSTDFYTQFVGQLSALASTAVQQITSFGGGARTTAEANNAVRFLFETGNIGSGTIKIYGVQKT